MSAILKAMHAVMSEVGAIEKGRTNPQQGYKFRGIDDVYNALAPMLARNGLCILPRCTERTVVERTNAKGTALFYVTVRAEFDFVAAEDGSKHTVVTYGEAMDSGDKATNKAMSAAYKYACMQAFSIPTAGDNDADATTHEVQSRIALVRKIADACIAKHAAGNEWGVHEEASALTDNEDKLRLWEMLREHSAVRATIKRMAQQEQTKETA